MTRLGLEVGYDPTWPAGLQYIRNLVYTLSELPADATLTVRLLPLDEATVGRVRDLGRFTFVELAAPVELSGTALQRRLIARRVKRRFLQPLLGRTLDEAFRGLDATYPGWGRPLPGIPQIEWIYDFQHLHLPHLFSPEERQKREQRISSIARSNGVVILSSNAALADLESVHPDATVTRRVWNFCSSLTEAEAGGANPHEAFDLPSFYLYVANQFWAHKDHLSVFKALVLLRERGLAPTVVCTGVMADGRTDAYVTAVRNFLREHDFQEQVRILGMIPRPDQIQVLRHCAAVIQPSLFEGWSTVVEDAKAVGRPVILSDLPVHREQMPQGTFFTTGSAESLADAVGHALSELTPGPDAAAEQRAAADTALRRRRLAAEFFDIVSLAIQLGPDRGR